LQKDFFVCDKKYKTMILILLHLQNPFKLSRDKQSLNRMVMNLIFPRNCRFDFPS